MPKEIFRCQQRLILFLTSVSSVFGAISAARFISSIQVMLKLLALVIVGVASSVSFSSISSWVFVDLLIYVRSTWTFLAGFVVWWSTIFGAYLFSEQLPLSHSLNWNISKSSDKAILQTSCPLSLKTLLLT